MGLLLFSTLSIFIFNVSKKSKMKYISTRNNKNILDFESVSLKVSIKRWWSYTCQKTGAVTKILNLAKKKLTLKI